MRLPLQLAEPVDPRACVRCRATSPGSITAGAIAFGRSASRTKARLLEANTPNRTVSLMDEARVVRSLAADDQLSPQNSALRSFLPPRC